MKKFSMEKNNKKYDILIIHGAWSTPIGFNYIKLFLDKNPNVDKIVEANYDAKYSTMNEILSFTEGTLDNFKNPVIIIGHSLGGVVALANIDNPKVVGVLTLAAPIGGIEINRFFKKLFDFFSATRAPVLSDIVSGSNFMVDLKHKLEDCYITRSPSVNLVMMIASEGYNPSILEPSDGVLTIRCQEEGIPMWSEKVLVPVNHSEILQSPRVLEKLGEMLS